MRSCEEVPFNVLNVGPCVVLLSHYTPHVSEDVVPQTTTTSAPCTGTSLSLKVGTFALLCLCSSMLLKPWMSNSPLYQRCCLQGLSNRAVAPTLAFIGLLWKSLRNLQFEVQVGPPAKLSPCLQTRLMSPVMLCCISHMPQGSSHRLNHTHVLCVDWERHVPCSCIRRDD